MLHEGGHPNLHLTAVTNKMQGLRQCGQESTNLLFLVHNSLTYLKISTSKVSKCHSYKDEEILNKGFASVYLHYTFCSI